MIKLALMILDDFSTVSSRTEGEGSAPQPTRIMAKRDQGAAQQIPLPLRGIGMTLS